VIFIHTLSKCAASGTVMLWARWIVFSIMIWLQHHLIQLKMQPVVKKFSEL